MRERVDVYSLACVAYELFTGKPPFSSETNLGLLLQHATDVVPPMNAALRSLGNLAHARKVNVDVRGFQTTIGRFAANAAKHDNATKRVATGSAADREMAAARVLDLTVYGVDGDTSISFPDVVRAIREGDQNAVDIAVGRARTTLDRAGALIVQ